MQAVQFSAYGGPETLEVIDVPEPHAGPGQVRIAVRAAGVNAIDWKIRAGVMAGDEPLAAPSGTGLDAAGVVDEIGDGVTGVAIGDEVFGTGSATYAEFAVLDGWAAKASTLSFEAAAGYPIPVETAVRILGAVGARAGETVLVSGASGGVGSSVLQIARARGITTVATAGAANQDYLTALGAIATTYGEGLVERVRALVPNGVDAALDIAGSGVIPELIELTGDPARVLSIADFSAAELGAQVSSERGDLPAALREAVDLFVAGGFSLPVEKTFTLSQAGEAQATSAAGHAAGRLIIAIA